MFHLFNSEFYLQSVVSPQELQLGQTVDTIINKVFLIIPINIFEWSYLLS